MRPPRIAILILFLASSFFLIGRAITSTARSTPSKFRAAPKVEPKKKSVWNFMYYNTPFSLFPPNAAISLTDDNSTSFAARPAAFGPKLATSGLSGQLWVGSGFSDDTRDGEGELGCSDLPGWDATDARTSLRNSLRAVTEPRVTTSQRVPNHEKRTGGDMLLDRDNRAAIAKGKMESGHTVDDGTDDYLHEGFTGSAGRRRESSSSHADIQSLQESAEIEGKVILLMRGGCGFLEKVMWAQRRGAIAVIVGDNQKGGPLIQMFAHGEDVDNVTIPSVFTARTTAQLLSSLTQPGSFIEDSLDDNGNPVLKVQQGNKSGKGKSKSQGLASTTRTADSPKSTAASSKEKRSAFPYEGKTPSHSVQKRGWFSNLFGWGQSSHPVDEDSRPPDTGRRDWILVEDWNEEKDKVISETLDKSKKGSKSDDDFIIGVHDWRDPDMIDKPRPSSQNGRESEKPEKKPDSKAAASSKDPDRNSNNPYKALPKGFKGAPQGGPGNGYALVNKIFGSRDDKNAEAEHSSTPDAKGTKDPVADKPSFGPHEGLWVTISPTSSASPFFDTLLVLVISPLVTLTVVYALLILRARIRRRRWRAPKSVVERLPVRTYHTVAASPSPSSRQPSPSSTSPTTPLLQQSPPLPRPRSRTATGIPESDNLLGPSEAIPTTRPSSRGGTREHEKGAGGFSAEWKKYMGRQVECVVCLEEYVDGVSRVMSLPCGHEFHADCM